MALALIPRRGARGAVPVPAPEPELAVADVEELPPLPSPPRPRGKGSIKGVKSITMATGAKAAASKSRGVKSISVIRSRSRSRSAGVKAPPQRRRRRSSEHQEKRRNVRAMRAQRGTELLGARAVFQRAVKRFTREIEDKMRRPSSSSTYEVDVPNFRFQLSAVRALQEIVETELIQMLRLIRDAAMTMKQKTVTLQQYNLVNRVSDEKCGLKYKSTR